MDNDGDNEVLGWSWNWFSNITHISIYENLGNNDFVEHENTYLFGLPIFHISDVNKDGLPDLICGGSTIYVIYNDGHLEIADEPNAYFGYEYDGSYFFKKCFCADLDRNLFDDMIVVRDFGQNKKSKLNIISNDGNGNFVQEPQVSVDNYELGISDYNLQNYPNPFNLETIINYNLSNPGMVNLSIYNIKGELIKTLLNEKEKAGERSVLWNGKDNYQKQVSSGIYLYKMKAGKYTSTKKMILLK